MKWPLVSLVGFCLLANAACASDPRDPWIADGERAIQRAKQLRSVSSNVAGNVILFVGDGMGVSTVTAARILDGQRRGDAGEENLLSFEHFPHVALTKTYNTTVKCPTRPEP
jgi:alkaline phosphatase